MNILFTNAGRRTYILDYALKLKGLKYLLQKLINILQQRSIKMLKNYLQFRLITIQKHILIKF